MLLSYINVHVMCICAALSNFYLLLLMWRYNHESSRISHFDSPKFKKFFLSHKCNKSSQLLLLNVINNKDNNSKIWAEFCKSPARCMGTSWKLNTAHSPWTSLKVVTRTFFDTSAEAIIIKSYYYYHWY